MKNEKIIKIVQILLASQFIIWFGFGITRFFWMYNATIITLMAINAIIFLLLAYAVKLQNKLVYWFTIFYVGINAVLTITDQVGLYDYLTLALNLVTLITLFINKNKLLKLPGNNEKAHQN